MESNTHSSPGAGPGGRSERLASLAAVLDELATEDLTGLGDTALVEQTLELRRLVDGLEGCWLQRLAAVDARGAAGAEQGVRVGSTAAWLRNRLHVGAGAAAGFVRTARALFRGPLTATAIALTNGQISPAHASVLAHGTHALPAQVSVEAEPVLLEAASRLDPPRLRRIIGHLQQVADTDGADRDRERRHSRRGVWLAPTWEGMVALNGLLDSEGGQTLLAALEPLTRPADAHDARSGDQRRADGLVELARRNLESGRLPQTGGVRPQLAVVVELNSLLSHPGGLGGEVVAGEGGWAGPLAPEACRRLACDGTVARALAGRQPTHQQPGHHHPDLDHHPDHGPSANDQPATGDLCGEQGLAGRLRAAMALLPPILGGAPSQPLDVGRATRVVQPAQRTALAVRDGGCVFPDCARPLAWCEAHHLVSWLEGGPTDLPNLALLCRAHHRAVHEGGWQLTRGPDGRLTAHPPHRRPRAAA
jgi:Domain of unknown function (DUF222)/HNH endonuclease